MIEGVVPAESRAEGEHAWAWRLAPLAVGASALAVALLAFGRRSLSADEAQALSRTDGSFRDTLSQVVHHDPGQTGTLLLLRAARGLGESELALRLPFLLAIAFASALAVVLGTMLLGRLAGLAAGVAFAGNAAVLEASAQARPYALGLLGIVGSTLLLVWAIARGGGARWAAYAIAAALLPLTHPLAAAVIAAQAAALMAVRDRSELRRAGIALLSALAVAVPLLVWMAADRRGAADGAGNLDLADVARSLWHATGRNPILVAAAVGGLVALFDTARRASGAWPGVLVAGLVAAPVVGVVVASTALPVFPAALVLVAPGLALAAGASLLLLPSDAGLGWVAVAVLAVAAAVTVGVRVAAGPQEDWRALAAAVERVRRDDETVVVVPEGARAALAYYAPDLKVIRFARNRGAWVAVVADTPRGAITAARPVVPTPRYALLRQFRYGSDLRLQHWVRP